MIDQVLLKEQVAAYLASQFKHVTITETARLLSDDGTAFRIQADNEEYQLRILDEVLNQENIPDINTFLEENNAAQVMRELIEFPVTITSNGCVFDDI